MNQYLYSEFRQNKFRIENEVEIMIEGMIEESFHNQSLRDSLKRTDDDIRGFLDIMKRT